MGGTLAGGCRGAAARPRGRIGQACARGDKKSAPPEVPTKAARELLLARTMPPRGEDVGAPLQPNGRDAGGRAWRLAQGSAHRLERDAAAGPAARAARHLCRGDRGRPPGADQAQVTSAGRRPAARAGRPPGAPNNITLFATPKSPDCARSWRLCREGAASGPRRPDAKRNKQAYCRLCLEPR